MLHWYRCCSSVSLLEGNSEMSVKMLAAVACGLTHLHSHLQVGSWKTVLDEHKVVAVVVEDVVAYIDKVEVNVDVKHYDAASVDVVHNHWDGSCAVAVEVVETVADMVDILPVDIDVVMVDHHLVVALNGSL